MNKKQVLFMEHQYCNDSEKQFYQTYGHYPQNLYLKLRELDFTRENAWTPIQLEMDRIFNTQKFNNDFIPVTHTPFD